MASQQKLQRASEEIIAVDSHMRFVGIIDLEGNIVEGIMKEGKTSLESQKESEHFCKQVAERRSMREEFDRTLGKVQYVHVKREKVTQIVLYTKKYTVFVAVEPDLDIIKKVDLMSTVKKISSHL